MMHFSGYTLDKLHDDGELVLYRGRDLTRENVLISIQAGDPPGYQSLLLLENELALASQLDARWAVYPRALVSSDGRAGLILDDPAGDLLENVLPLKPFDVSVALQLGIGIAGCLRQLHRRDLIHKDLRPANVFVSGQTVRLTGLGHVSRLSRERQQPRPIGQLTGSVAYMSPEQTGRMNRSVDARSDLYSLGVILFEILTGSLPFTASEPMEWVHCHIARKPRRLETLRPNLPPVLADIVMKLLAKSADDRYQTASGVEADLRACLSAWHAHGHIPSFPLGRDDKSDRLLLPERLYGREADIARLTAAFGRAATGGGVELVLVSGPSGIGKSSIVRELHRTMVPPTARFAEGKFDQHMRSVPYATLAGSLRYLIREILSEPESEVRRWRSKLQEVVGATGQLIVQLVPELETLIGPQPDVTELEPQHAKRRFEIVLKRFIAAVAQPEHPLVLFIDDLQWVDPATLDIVRAIVCDPHSNSLLIVGAYRTNEVGPTHALSLLVNDLRVQGHRIETIELFPLEERDIGQFLAQALHTSEESVRLLATFVLEKTDGNPFFAIQFVSALVDEGLLSFDQDEGRWRWYSDRAPDPWLDSGVVNLLSSRLQRLPEATRIMLSRLSLLGSTAQVQSVAAVAGTMVDQVHIILEPAIRTGLLQRHDEVYQFLHDKVREAACELIPSEMRTAERLMIARALAGSTSPDSLSESAFEIVSHFNAARILLEDLSETEYVARLNLLAGKRARQASASWTAFEYFKIGRDLLGEQTWDRDYSLAFELEFGLAESEFLIGQPQRAEQRLSELASRSSDLHERETITWLLVTIHTATGHLDRAVKTCLDYLANAGIELPSRPGQAEVSGEFQQLKKELIADTIDDRLKLPLIADERQQAILNVLTAVLPPAFFTDRNLVSLVLCRMANISRRYGNCSASALGYAYLGMILGPTFGEFRAGYKFGRLGLSLVEHPDLKRFKGRVYMTFGYHVLPYREHMRNGHDLIRQAFDLALEAGDLTYCGFSTCTLISSMLASGVPLPQVQREAERGLSFVRQAHFGLIVEIVSTQLRLIQTLRGGTATFGVFDDENFAESTYEAHLSQDPALAIANCWYWIRKLQARFLAGDYKAAQFAASKAEPLLWTTGGHLEFVEYTFYSALSWISTIGSDPGSSQARRRLSEATRQFEIWAENCPENFGHHFALLQAEVAQSDGRDFDAVRHYDDAITSAREHGFLQVEALACEQAGRFYARRGIGQLATTCFRQARHAYVSLGAQAKVQQLEAQFPDVSWSDQAVTSNTHSNRAIAGPVDLAAVVRTSQVLLSEVGLPHVLESLMMIVMQHAGASSGILALPRADDLLIHAVAASSHDGIEVWIGQRPVTDDDIPPAILAEAMRSRSAIIQGDNGSAESKSVLCMPLVNRRKVIGVIFLENKLVSDAFSPERIEVLELLAAQAAISLENAILEEKEALLKEVHHRVKNNMQLISSMLNLQAARIADPIAAGMLADSRNRIRSMALVHENLYRAGDFARVELGDHIRNLCTQLKRAYLLDPDQIHFTTRLDNVSLDIDRAISCGLIINELVSNALKHGFPDGRTGQVTVVLRRDSEDLFIEVADDGIGISDDTLKVDTLGLQLVHSLTDQLDGKLSFDGTRGSKFTIKFPAEERGSRADA